MSENIVNNFLLSTVEERLHMVLDNKNAEQLQAVV
jgi:hypothetical protein